MALLRVLAVALLAVACGTPSSMVRTDLQAYVDREDWVLQFNAMLVACPVPRTEHGS